MSFTIKQLIFSVVSVCGAVLVGTGIGLYRSEEISFMFCAMMCLVGGVMLIASVVFLHRKMRCSFCHRLYPLYCWWGMERCPYCGEYYD